MFSRVQFRISTLLYHAKLAVRIVQENLQSILSSEQKVSELINQLDFAINEVENLESQLDSYDEVLSHVRNTIEKMEQKNILIQIVNKNNDKLLSQLEKVVVRFKCGLDLF